MLQHAHGLGLLALLAALAACAAPPSSPPSAAARPVLAAAPAPPPLPWPDAADCRALASAIVALKPEDRARLSAENAPIALLVEDGPLPLRPEEAERVIDADLPIPAADTGTSTRCLVVAARPSLLPGGGRRLVGHELVRSEYRTGSRRRANPDYAALRAAADDEDGGGGGRVMRTGDPMLDLIGLAAGAVIRGVGRLRPDRPDAAAQLASTDRYKEEAVYTPYSYEISSFEVGRAGVMELALVDRSAARVYSVRHTMRERRVLPVAEGRHRADRGLLEGGGPEAVLPEDVAVFEAAAPRPRLSELLQALVEGGGEGRQGTAADALADLGPLPADAASPGSAEAAPDRTRRATVETMAGPVEGEWTDAEHIAIPSTAVGRSSLVEVSGPDGMRSFGLVERIDQASGRALVRVGRPTGARKLSDEGLASVLRDLKADSGR